MLDTTWLYFSLVLADIFSATLFKKRVASGAIPPVDRGGWGGREWTFFYL